MTIIADLGFVVAIMNENDQWRNACLSLYRTQAKVYLPHSTLSEIAYLIGRERGNIGVADFLTGLPKMKFELVTLLDEDLARTAELLRQYSDLRVDYVDSTVVAIAERLKITRILTLDHRDFNIIRPRHTGHFTLLPQKS